MNCAFQITIASPPDREKLVAEVFFGNEQVAEINQESERLQVEIYACRSDGPWVFPFADFVGALNQAKHRLVGPG